MTASDSYLHVPARGRGPTLGLRIIILVVDFATIIALSVSLGLYHKWVPATSYPTTALHPTTHTDWTDPIVLVAVLVSFIWTCFITMRLAWMSKALHLGYYVAFEFVILVWLLACTIPALISRDASSKNIIATSDNCGSGTVTLMKGNTAPWVCMSHLDTLKKLQIANYIIACAVAVLHLILVSLACHSTTKLPQDRTHTTNGPNQTIAQKTVNIQNSTARANEANPPSRPAIVEMA